MDKKRNQWTAWLYLLPAIVLLAIFTVWPIINTIRMAMLEGYNLDDEMGGMAFSFGFSNFKKVIEYPTFTNRLGTTMLLTVLTVPISTLLALVIAVLLNSIKFVKKIFQTIFFLPYVTNSIAIGMVFAAMFAMLNPLAGGGEYVSIGLMNTILKAFGISPVNWINLNASYSAQIAVMTIYIVWNALPFKILILLGGLQGVNKQYYEAAKVDGTSKWRTFWRITVPMLSPMIAYVVITGFIGGFKEYSSILGVFGDSMGANNHDVDTIVGFIYQNIAGNSSNQGRASAAALILFAIIFAVTMVNMYVSKKKVHY